jgi:hypothetical protein
VGRGIDRGRSLGQLGPGSPAVCSFFICSWSQMEGTDQVITGVVMSPAMCVWGERSAGIWLNGDSLISILWYNSEKTWRIGTACMRNQGHRVRCNVMLSPSLLSFWNVCVDSRITHIFDLWKRPIYTLIFLYPQTDQVKICRKKT